MWIDEIWIQIENTVAKGSKDVLHSQDSLFSEESVLLVYLVKQVEKLCSLHLWSRLSPKYQTERKSF